MGGEGHTQNSHPPSNTGLSLRLQGYYWNTLEGSVLSKAHSFFLSLLDSRICTSVYVEVCVARPLPLLPVGHACVRAFGNQWRPIFPR